MPRNLDRERYYWERRPNIIALLLVLVGLGGSIFSITLVKMRAIRSARGTKGRRIFMANFHPMPLRAFRHPAAVVAALMGRIRCASSPTLSNPRSQTMTTRTVEVPPSRLRRRPRLKLIVALSLIVGICSLLFFDDSRAQIMSDMVLGNTDAPVTIIEYASMTCPHCGAFHRNVLPKLKAEYIDTGKVRLIYRDFPLDGLALRAAMTARCGGPDRYFAFVDVIYLQKETPAHASDPIAALGQLARLGGLSGDAFRACMQDKALEEYILQTRLDGQKQFNVNSTPTFIIQGKPYTGLRDFSALQAIVDPLLGKN